MLLAAAALLTVMSAPRPNVIVILADDLGFSDLGCYGGEIHTPNLDRMAGEGVRFTQFYNMARCCPTRASLLTGLYPHQTGVGEMNQDRGMEAFRGEINNRCATIAEVLRPQGYHTGMVGKWHLVHLNIASLPGEQAKRLMNFEETGPISPSTKNWPCNRGFDDHWGTIPGVDSYWDPYGLVHNETPIERDSKDFYYTDFITDHSVDMIDRLSKDPSKPFFLYVAYTAPHWPMQAKQEDVDRYKGVYDKGWDEIRRERYERQIKMGLIDAKWDLSPRAFNPGLADRDSQVSPWSSAKNKEWEATRMATYAAMVETMDRGIGKILAQLKKSKIDENTVVIFLSDNGACQENVQPSWYDIPTRTRDGRTIHIGNDAKYMPGGDETVYQSYGPMWANASNTPFRKFKHFAEEGGISAPFIVRYPNGKLPKGHIEKQTLGHVTDVMPTILELTGTTYPENKIPVEGRSLVATLKDGQPVERDLFWEHEGNRAMRRGEWKIVADAGQPWQLYNVVEDRTELHNLATTYPHIKDQLVEAWTKWAKRVGALPRP